MQSNTKNVWTLSDANFNEDGLGELIFGDNINQTFLITKHVGQEPTDTLIVAGQIIGMIQYPGNNKLEGIPLEVTQTLNGIRRSRSSPIAPSRALTPGWVRPFAERAVGASGGLVARYSEDFSRSIWLGFIAGQSDLCQFSYHFTRLGLMLGESWKPDSVTTFREDIMRRELELSIVTKRTEHFLDAHKALRKSLAGLETLGCVPFFRTKGGDVIKLSEVELFFEVFDPLRHLGAILREENLTQVEKRRMTSLANLIKDAQPDEIEWMREIAKKEVDTWKPEWKEAMTRAGEVMPIQSSIEKTDLDTVKYPIIDSFIDAGFFEAFDLNDRIYVKATTAGFVVLGMILNP